jgi:hypothetical protein
VELAVVKKKSDKLLDIINQSFYKTGLCFLDTVLELIRFLSFRGTRNLRKKLDKDWNYTQSYPILSFRPKGEITLVARQRLAILIVEFLV